MAGPTMTVAERIDVLEKVAANALREASVASLQLLTVIASSDEANYSTIKARVTALEKFVDGVVAEIERLVEEHEDGQG
jgi:hypothetical protein